VLGARILVELGRPRQSHTGSGKKIVELRLGERGDPARFLTSVWRVVLVLIVLSRDWLAQCESRENPSQVA
jgi:hypothetical protein